MENVIDEAKKDIIEKLIAGGELEATVALLKKQPTVEVAEIMEELMTEEQVLEVLSNFDQENQGAVFSDFDKDLQLWIFEHMDKMDFSDLFSHMSSDVRADFYQELEKDQQLELLPYLKKPVREDVIHLSSYPPETAGGIMSTDFATILSHMTVAEAIEKVRKDAPSKKMVYYIYVVDKKMKLQGFITLKDLIMASPGDMVESYVHTEFTYAEVNEDRESVAQKVERYDLVAIPVINPLDQLVGIVSHDDVIDVIRAEHTEDFEKFMGIVPDKEDNDYLDTTVIQHFKKRAVWIVTLAAVGIISGMIVHSFEDTIYSLMILALYMPMVADTGGNSGSQAATVVVRALALGDVNVGNWMKILYKEFRVSILLAVCLGLLAYAKILFLSWETDIPEAYSLYNIAFVISSALSIQVVTATVIGAGLPLLVRRFGGDPAVAASPAITTVVDITGLLIYFTIATTFLL
ncbi:MAG: magnesium transporter [Cyclobacteriaceae bacterium]|nr:magnesium transporter [Cyclobacteriaceae bacterium]MCH8517317.1 magnesium transporter [Cyclobacteriaceae bacterium]